MSIHEMISRHPDVAGNPNEALAAAARHAMFCALMCTSCADACVAEEMDMAQCIRSCLDCADVCTATARLAVRRTGQNVEVLRAMLGSPSGFLRKLGLQPKHRSMRHALPESSLGGAS